MSKIKLIMISNESCVHCKKALEILNLFVEKNSKLVELKVIDFQVYRKTNVFGIFDSFPVFIFIGKSGNFKKFDFINDEKTDRTYEKLKINISDLCKLY